jgi:phosphoserine phosphatase RsbU/P
VATTKTLDLSEPDATSILIESAVLGRETAPLPVQQALGAIGAPESVIELAQRLVTTLSMLWSDLAGADLFLPHGPGSELRGVCDPVGGHALMSAIGVAQAANSDVRIIPSTPHLVAGDGSLGFGATMSVPVDGAETWAGFIILQRRASAPELTARDLDGLTALARGVSAILTRVQSRGGQAAAQWSPHDMASAREMQRMFLPRALESNSAGVRVLAEYLPAFAVGGDFYDFIDLGDGRLLAAIGDVSGKGVTAALMMSRISSELRRLAAEEAMGPGEILARLNASLPGRMQDDRFVTVAVVLLDLPKGRWVVANAGHVVPLLRRRSGSVIGLAYASGPPIGMMPKADFDEELFPVEPGDILLLSTDGVFELFAGHRRPCSTMGQCRLAEVVQSAPHDLAEIHRRILHAVEHAAHGRDDVALLGLELPG